MNRCAVCVVTECGQGRDARRKIRSTKLIDYRIFKMDKLVIIMEKWVMRFGFGLGLS